MKRIVQITIPVFCLVGMLFSGRLPAPAANCQQWTVCSGRAGAGFRKSAPHLSNAELQQRHDRGPYGVLFRERRRVRRFCVRRARRV
jgi:hypothetical protein